ncbi:hypothetical protein OHD16_03055 [Sphingobacterium sp. ML3W]|uniref:hypothetical protein n=1 Tax=Sphingobacterium sp. ML3W TaxID=1538644 RepID=UPI00249ABD70|nr:hypothetical protein [Sphingobacterium sp. ML3W]WFA78953.1 hypothetical protein OGI71_23295 [Sphingobacterium sp. ML3W]
MAHRVPACYSVQPGASELAKQDKCEGSKTAPGEKSGAERPGMRRLPGQLSLILLIGVLTP